MVSLTGARGLRTWADLQEQEVQEEQEEVMKGSCGLDVQWESPRSWSSCIGEIGGPVVPLQDKNEPRIPRDAASSLCGDDQLLLNVPETSRGVKTSSKPELNTPAHKNFHLTHEKHPQIQCEVPINDPPEWVWNLCWSLRWNESQVLMNKRVSATEL